MRNNAGWILFFISILLAGCTKNSDKKVVMSKDEAGEDLLKQWVGCYVTDGYEHREKGFDWVSVCVSQLNDSIAKITVRSRADIKKPTCVFDSKAKLINGNELESDYEGKRILFHLSHDTITVSVPDKDDENILYFFCSGGATLMGEYVKVKGDMDSTQLSHHSYIKHLSDKNFAFEIQTVDSLLIIDTEGFTDNDRVLSHLINNEEVEESKITDLDNDGYPELLVFLEQQSALPEGDVIGYSVINNTDIIPILYTPVTHNKSLKSMYAGNDSFEIRDHKLIQIFTSSANNKPVVVHYMLKNNGANKEFTIDYITGLS
ncbi:MAG: hypothetical protein ACRCX4_03455 [Bacteroidales bacterium]